MRRILAGLSPTHKKIMELLTARPHTAKELADALGVEVDTVRSYLSRLDARLKKHGRNGLVVLFEYGNSRYSVQREETYDNATKS